MPVKIFQRESPILRKIAGDVSIDEIRSAKVKKVISNMKKALASQEDGVAIAAPQIGIPLRIFIVAGKVLNYIKEEEETKTKYPDLVFINPKILKASKEKKYMEEGCLSVRYLYGKVRRSTKVQISAYDEGGKTFKMGSVGLMAQIFQHETDHLNGILFIDFAKDLEEVSSEKMRARSHSKI